MTDSPDPIDVTSVPKATALENEFEPSSIFQPVMSMLTGPKFVSSNQSAVYGLLLLPHEATSVIRMSALACELKSNNAATAQAKILMVVSPSVQRYIFAGQASPDSSLKTV